MFRTPCAECHKQVDYVGEKEEKVLYLCQECGDNLLNMLFFDTEEPILN